MCCEEAYIVEKVSDVKGKFTETGQARAVFEALRQNKIIITDINTSTHNNPHKDTIVQLILFLVM